MNNNTAPAQSLDEMVAEAGKLFATLESARERQRIAQADIDAAIGPYVTIKTRISCLLESMIEASADAHSPVCEDQARGE